MSRAARRKMKRIQRNRMISVITALVIFTLILTVFVCNTHVVAEKPDTYKYYTEVRIDRGDTLSGIAARYMTEEYSSEQAYIREVQQINHLGYELTYGQTILVPYYSEEIK